jgi:hypothetical protein
MVIVTTPSPLEFFQGLFMLFVEQRGKLALRLWGGRANIGSLQARSEECRRNGQLPKSRNVMRIDDHTETDVRACTVKDVAKLAGVSTATVSRVVNSTDHVSCETRTKVLAAVSKLRYLPNGHAAELGRSNAGIPKKRSIATPVLRGRRAR